jgi:hypothetical protein
MPEVFRFSGFSALPLLAASLVAGPAVAETLQTPLLPGGHATAPTAFVPATSGAGIRTPSVSTALATALSVDGPSQRNPNSYNSPAVQVGVAAAVSIDGNSSAAARNSNATLGGPAAPAPQPGAPAVQVAPLQTFP